MRYIARVTPVRITVALLLFLFTGCGGCNDDDDEYDFRLLKVHGAQGTDPGLFNTPLGIQIRGVPPAGSPRVFVADYGNRRVQAIEFTLHPSSQPDSAWVFGESPVDTGDVIWPASVTVTQALDDISVPRPDSMYLYVTDLRKDRICKFGMDGSLVLTWGESGTDTGQFISPLGIDTDFAGDIYVADSGNHRIQVFDTLGNFLRMWGGFGSDPGQFNGPGDVGVGLVYEQTSVKFIAVSDHGNNRIQLFDTQGNLLSVVGGIPGPVGLNGFKDRVWVLSPSTKTLFNIYAGNPRSASISRGSRLPDCAEPYDVDGSGHGASVSDRGTHKVVYYQTTATY